MVWLFEFHLSLSFVFGEMLPPHLLCLISKVFSHQISLSRYLVSSGDFFFFFGKIVVLNDLIGSAGFFCSFFFKTSLISQ